jgi:uncharacterized protein (TIGR02301 family)
VRRGAALIMLLAATVSSRAAEPPYGKEFARLAEILGSLHYLTGLCDPAPSPWRAEMQQLIAAENPDADFRAKLVDRFNIGFSSFASVYRRCTASAEAAIERYREEGAELIEGLATGFGAAAEPAR